MGGNKESLQESGRSSSSSSPSSAAAAQQQQHQGNTLTSAAVEMLRVARSWPVKKKKFGVGLFFWVPSGQLVFCACAAHPQWLRHLFALLALCLSPRALPLASSLTWPLNGILKRHHLYRYLPGPVHEWRLTYLRGTWTLRSTREIVPCSKRQCLESRARTTFR